MIDSDGVVALPFTSAPQRTLIISLKITAKFGAIVVSRVLAQ